jgi:lipid-binding SYLF domain-containing protein
MPFSSTMRAALIALTAFVGATLSSAAYADSGTVSLVIYKAGWIIGGSGGSGTLTFRGRSYALSSGGLDYGLVFGGSKTVLRGRVSNINRPSDVAGVYGAAGAGIAVGSGARAIVLTNQKGAVLELSGRQTGLMANADLSGLAITIK